MIAKAATESIDCLSASPRISCFQTLGYPEIDPGQVIFFYELLIETPEAFATIYPHVARPMTCFLDAIRGEIHGVQS